MDGRMNEEISLVTYYHWPPIAHCLLHHLLRCAWQQSLFPLISAPYNSNVSIARSHTVANSYPSSPATQRAFAAPGKNQTHISMLPSSSSLRRLFFLLTNYCPRRRQEKSTRSRSSSSINRACRR